MLPYDGGTYIQAPFEDLLDSYVVTLANGKVIRGLLANYEVETIFNGNETSEKKKVTDLANDFSEYKLYDKDAFIEISSIQYMTKTEQYQDLASNLHDIDLSKVIEEMDNTDLQGEAACAAGACEAPDFNKNEQKPAMTFAQLAV
jgi:hypothetical protein